MGLQQSATIDLSSKTTSTAPLSDAEQAAYTVAQAAAAAAQMAAAQAAADDQTARSAVATIVQSCVGVTWQNLTTAQKQALIVALLYRAGALDKNLTVQPLASWLTR
jgi:hypothetical protein